MSQIELHKFINAGLSKPKLVDLVHGSAVVYTGPAEPASQNQDSAAILELDESRVVFVVADGMGGGPAGAAASGSAVEAIIRCVIASEERQLNLRSGILDGFEAAQDQVQQLTAGAATTLLVVEVVQGSVRAYHAGDSGACVFGRGGRLKLATDFHSPVGYAVKSGLLDEDDALDHQDRHIVSNIIGMPDMTVEVGSPLALARYDTLVLGSDGLFDNLYPQELIDWMRHGDLLTTTSQLQHQVSQRMQQPQPGVPSKLDDLTVLTYRRTN